MLKKVILGIVGFLVVAITGLGVYIYTLDWNQHKSVVSQRLAQITGLKVSLNGNLKVELFPTPKVTTLGVQFFPNSGGNSPLIMVNEITANLDLMPLFDNKFIINSMTLTGATVNLEVSEQGQLNWDRTGLVNSNKSGNVEVSFNDIRLSNSTISYKNLQNQKEFSISGISANISAPSLKGPYRTNGKFIHNNTEILFKGDIVKNDNIHMNMLFENPQTASKFTIDGSVGSQANGNITFDTRNLFEISSIIFGADTIYEKYNASLLFSFQYDYTSGLTKLTNFAVKYGNDVIGSGTMVVTNDDTNKDIVADFNMTKFDLNLIENFAQDFIQYTKDKKKIADTKIYPYSLALNLKSGNSSFNQATVQDLILGLTLKEGILDVTRFGGTFPGETTLNTVGKIDLNNNCKFIFNSEAESQDLRTFASVFGIDLTKLTPKENIKSVFKHAKTQAKLRGDIDGIEVLLKDSSIDTTNFDGNIIFINTDEQNSVEANLNASKIIFDKYLLPIPAEIKNQSYKDKFIYQLKLLPWGQELNINGNIRILGAVYNEIPLEDIALEFTMHQDNLSVNKLYIKNMANTQLEAKFDASQIFTDPQFGELSYNIKSADFPTLKEKLGIKTSSLDLFKRKLFATQGVLKGNFSNFDISSVLKFGDIEFSYTGMVSNSDKDTTFVNGDLEFKTHNYLNLLKALNLDYTPKLPVTPFTASGKINGTPETFEFSAIDAFLGANNIKGSIILDNSTEKSKLKAELDFEKFDADHWLTISPKIFIKQNTPDSRFVNIPKFNDEQIDYTDLNKIDFDIQAKARTLIYNGKTYNDTRSDFKLKQGILNVASFETHHDTDKFSTNFILDTNQLPKIQGRYNFSQSQYPSFGGNVYGLSIGTLNSEGSFSSSANSVAEFIENLNSDGKFQLLNVNVTGWDLDIIKFDLEQRKTINGFEDVVLKSLQTGKSEFSSVEGNYKINSGIITANDTIWKSPVANIKMDLDLNLSNHLFNGQFAVLFYNASFSDIIKFAMNGDLANPKISTDLSESIKRINDTESMINDAIKQENNEKRQKLEDQITDIQQDIDTTLIYINNLYSDMQKYKPISNNTEIIKIYDTNLADIHVAENRIKQLQIQLNKATDQSLLKNIGNELGIEKAKLKFIPKTLEDNYVVDSKYVYDEILNKISWLNNVATFNSAYYNNLIDQYRDKIDELRINNTPIADNIEKLLKETTKRVSADMEKINTLNSKVRDDYLYIVDTTRIVEMKDNNDIASQALETMLSYVHKLNKDILISLDAYQTSLHLDKTANSLMPAPEKVDDIDITKPIKGIAVPSIADEASPENEQSSDTSPVENNTESKDTPETISLNLNFDGLSKLAGLLTPKSTEEDIPAVENKVTKDIANNSPDEETNTIPETPVLLADNTSQDIPEKDIASEDNTSNNTNTVEMTVAQTDITVTDIQPENLVDVKTDTKDEAEAIEAPKTSSFKRNPVIALELGKETIPAVQNSLDNDVVLKSDFKFKRKRFNDVIASFPEKYDFDFPVKTLALQEQLVENKPLFSSLHDNITKDDIFSLTKNDTSISLAQETTNHYLFPVSKTNLLLNSGIVKKSMLKNISTPIPTLKSNRYVFAANDGTRLDFSGYTQKQKTLAVK